MLPTTTRPPKPGRAYAAPLLSGSSWAALRARARLTNLAVLLLGSALALSCVLNFALLVPASPRGLSGAPWLAAKPADAEGWDDLATLAQLTSGRPLSIETTVERAPALEGMDHLVLVPGHAIWLGADAAAAARAESDNADWVLEPMQKRGSVKTFVRHIEMGAQVIRDDPKAVLVFSGGQTRPYPSPPLPEGQSYHRLATLLGLLPSTSSPSGSGSAMGYDGTSASPALAPAHRATSEEFALDSYENLLFSLARFREFTGVWPRRVTVVGYGMKQRRFEQLHRAAIRFPAADFAYIGIDDDGDTTEHYAGELKFGFTPFLSAPSGCHPPLSIKRQLRNPFARYHPYHASCPELSGLLEWCPASPREDVARVEDMVTYGGEVPWA
ncbi:hypothetical protein Q5752_000254 [Cryptotrichosporon argae]